MTTGYVTITPEIARAFYGTQAPCTIRGYAYLKGGEPIVLWGFIRESYRWVLFLEAKDGARSYDHEWRRILALGIRKLRPLLDELRAPVHALADPDIDGSCELLEHIGFEPFNQRIYQWPRPSRSYLLH